MKTRAEQEAMWTFVALHDLICFGCGSEAPEAWAKTGTSKKGPWAICLACVQKRDREEKQAKQATYARQERTVYVDREVRVPVLPSELVRRAIQLTHPDRHPPERAGLANAVTAELLALLENGEF